MREGGDGGKVLAYILSKLSFKNEVTSFQSTSRVFYQPTKELQMKILYMRKLVSERERIPLNTIIFGFYMGLRGCSRWQILSGVRRCHFRID